MPLTLLDLPALVKPSAALIRELARALRKTSDGGKKITRDEARAIGEKLVALGQAFLKAAAD